MPDRPVTHLRRAPRLLPNYLRALRPARRDGTTSPREVLALAAAPVDPGHVSRYRTVCGWPPDAGVPLTYPHVLAFPLAMSLMTQRGFPFSAVGLVHLANRIDQLSPLRMGEPLDLRVWVDAPQTHPAGTTVDVHATAGRGDTVVWRSVSTYLRRLPRTQRAGEVPPPSPPADTAVEVDATWRVPANTGRAYAAVSGDRNPIHLSAPSARPFGFRRAIAHGMWSAARCLAHLDQVDGETGYELPPTRRFEVMFRSPLTLPDDVRLRAEQDRRGWVLELRSAHSQRWYLRGGLTAIAPAT